MFKATPELMIQHHGKTLFPLMKEWHKRRSIPSVLLFTGQSGIGKKSMIRFLAGWILCERQGFYTTRNEPEPSPCGECFSCQRLISGNDIHFTEIQADSDEESGTHSSPLKIEQFRKLKTSMGFAATQNQAKMILIPAADRMTVQAANSVLKLLEETPSGWLFFLTANDPTLLLPTITSRCQIFRLKPFSVDQIIELLKTSDVPPERAQLIALLSQGSWKRARLLASDEIWETRKVLFQFLKSPSSTVHTLVDWASLQSTHFDTVIDLLEQLTTDLIRWSASSPLPQPEDYPWIQFDGKEILSSHARAYVKRYRSIDGARLAWIEHAERLAQTRQKSALPLNKKILIQDALLPWLSGGQA